ncbi:MAG: PilZ domain-containing protein [Rhodospirillales bacterium]|nr:PilZ domain-containing protein [Rhodospirillales bacterium]
MPTRILRRTAQADDRRTSHRLPIEREVRYRVFSGRNVTITGMGKTLNISSGGVLFTTETQLPKGERVELSVSWPAQLNDSLPLKLVALGRLVRCEESKAALAIERYEFKTQGSHGL